MDIYVLEKLFELKRNNTNVLHTQSRESMAF